MALPTSFAGFAHSWNPGDWNLSVSGLQNLDTRVQAKAWFDDGMPVGCIIQVVSASTTGLRITENGETPTATVGFELLAGQSAWYANARMTQIIPISGTATVNIGYFSG